MEWIKIKDKPPKPNQRVIYYFKETGIHRGYYWYSHGYDCFGNPDGWLCDDVTHWQPDEGQPLPEPPK